MFLPFRKTTSRGQGWWHKVNLREGHLWKGRPTWRAAVVRAREPEGLSSHTGQRDRKGRTVYLSEAGEDLVTKWIEGTQINSCFYKTWMAMPLAEIRNPRRESLRWKESSVLKRLGLNLLLVFPVKKIPKAFIKMAYECLWMEAWYLAPSAPARTELEATEIVQPSRNKGINGEEMRTEKIIWTHSF